MPGSSYLTLFTRLGFAARGLLYIVIAWLVFTSGRSEDPSGALIELGRNGGAWLLLLMAAGFVAYGLWRVSDALLNIEGHELNGKGTRQRLGAAGSGIVHLLLAFQAYRLSQGEGGGGGGGAQESARTALDLPGGWLMLLAAGLVLLGAGIFQLVKAAKLSFCDKLDPQVANRDWVKWMGRFGYTARGLVFILSGVFIATAGLKGRASEAGGMEQALAWLSSPWNLLVAAGLLLFGLFSLVEARFRRIHEIPVERMAQAAREQLPG